jgi:hypothetical protein
MKLSQYEIDCILEFCPRPVDLRLTDLTDADLSYANLRDADLSRTDLTDADLSDADLSYANLRDADLSYANLRDADLSYTNLTNTDLTNTDLTNTDLTGANLSYADLSYANLNDADLSGATGLLNPIEWLKGNFERNESGELVVYKIFGLRYKSPDGWEIKAGSIINEVVNHNRTTACGCGINVATLEWCKREQNKHGYQIWKCYIPKEAECTIVIPYNTDGKFRVGQLRIGEIVS